MRKRNGVPPDCILEALPMTNVTKKSQNSLQKWNLKQRKHAVGVEKRQNTDQLVTFYHFAENAAMSKNACYILRK
jgi:hypothetical protein